MSSFPALDVEWASGPDAAALSDLLSAALDDFHPTAIEVLKSNAGEGHATERDRWRVFFGSAVTRDRAANHLRRAFGDRLLEIEATDVPDEDGARRSQADLRAVRIGRLVVAPPWDDASGDEASIVIDPSTGFGTGHHETTRLCLGLLQELQVTGRHAIDVGTGSGVLAIAASKLGARRVVALDNDPDALRNARENVARNGCRGIEVREADLSSLTIEPADIVMANLTAGVLERYAGELQDLVEEAGSLIVSGFGPDESTDVAAALSRFEVRRQASEGAWTALMLR